MLPRTIDCKHRYITKGHLYGESHFAFLAEENLGYVYVRIPKNASSWVTTTFKGIHFNFVGNKYMQPLPEGYPALKSLICPKKYICVLRDPIERWISGVCQALGPTTISKGYDYVDVLRDFDRWQNTHTEPQISFLQGLEHKHMIWFYMNNHFEYNFTNWCVKFVPDNYCYVNKNSNIENSYNFTSKKSLEWQKYQSGLNDFVYRSDKHINFLNDYYHEDCELIGNVKFYEEL